MLLLLLLLLAVLHTCRSTKLPNVGVAGQLAGSKVQTVISKQDPSIQAKLISIASRVHLLDALVAYYILAP